MLKNKYCDSLYNYKRLLTRVVNVGDIPLGGKHPIRVQSMTTTDTMDTDSTVNQSIRMIKAGSEYIRITAPSINEAKNLYNIKKILKSKGYNLEKQDLKEEDWFAVELEFQSRQARNKKGQLCFEFPIITRTREDNPLAECEV